jgi:hypothetical protein
MGAGVNKWSFQEESEAPRTSIGVSTEELTQLIEDSQAEVTARCKAELEDVRRMVKIAMDKAEAEETVCKAEAAEREAKARAARSALLSMARQQKEQLI